LKELKFELIYDFIWPKAKENVGIEGDYLVIKNATFEDSGNYSCFVRNHFGIASKNFSLRVISGENQYIILEDDK